MSALVGHDIETGNEIRISDTARRSGLYVLGRPGMGKTSLLINLIETDVQNSHGVFFLDPHGDGIDTLLTRLCSAHKRPDGTPILDPASSVLFLDPTSEQYSFGINLLACSDLSSRAARRDAYNRAYNVFYKLWQQEWDQRPWLRLIIQHTLHAFIENQGYTLADVPMFLDPANTGFREHIVSNIKYNEEVADFWRTRFNARREADQERQVDAALSRVSELLGDPDVRDIVGQSSTTLDFSDIIARGRILLLTLPPRLAYDSKRFIGTILINELLQAVYRRGELPPENRKQFCIFVDEFQHFCAWEDFTALFNEGRKYGIATTIAHQERYGQFADNKPIIGATDAAANKVMFALSVRDAEEIAPEFAKPPVAYDTRLEPVLTISQTPFIHLLSGHSNPRIRSFVNRYLRRLQHRWEDLPDEIGRTRMLRQSLVDQSGISRIDERVDALLGRDSNYELRHNALVEAQEALRIANVYTGDIVGLYERSLGYRGMIRYLDDFISGVMEGRIGPGQEEFSQFLIGRVLEASRIPESARPVLALYISLLYGDPQTARVIPFAFAQTHRLLPATSRAVEQQAADNAAAKREATIRQSWEYHFTHRREALEEVDTIKGMHINGVHYELTDVFHVDLHGFGKGKPHFDTYGCRLTDLIHAFMPLHLYPDLQSILQPYYTCRFAPPWADLVAGADDLLARLSHELQWLRLALRKAKRHNSPGFLDRLFSPLHDPASPGPPLPRAYFDEPILDGLEAFVATHREGALVVLVLLLTVHNLERWSYRVGAFKPDVSAEKVLVRSPWSGSPIYIWFEVLKEYPGFSMVYLPTILRRQPLDVALCLERIATFLTSTTTLQADCEALYWNLERSAVNTYSNAEDIGIKKFHGPAEIISKELEKKPDVIRLKKGNVIDEALRADLLSFMTLHGKTSLGRLTINYLLCRACDIFRFGEKVADITFPLPSVAGVAPELISNVVEMLVNWLAAPGKAAAEKEEREWHARCEEMAKEAGDAALKANTKLPAVLTAKVLNKKETDTIKAACLVELREIGKVSEWNSEDVLSVVGELVEFCTLLAKPENHIKVPSGQFIEKPAGLRTVADMTNEMAQALNRLDKFQAYAKIIEDAEGEMWNGSIWTPDPPTLPEWCRRLEQTSRAGGETPGSWNKQLQAAFAERTHLAGVTRDRLAVDKEITERRQRWKGTAGRNQPPPASQSTVKQLPPPPEPPPSYVSHQGSPAFRPRPR